MRRRRRSCSRSSARSRSLVGEFAEKLLSGLAGVVLRTAEEDWD
jgi:hypothetical protein